MDKLFTIVPIAGKGSRFGSDINKAFAKINGLPIIVYTLKNLNSVFVCRNVALVVADTDRIFVEDLLAEYKDYFPNLEIMLVTGGKERQDSVFNALGFIPDEFNFVAVHDGARPFVSPEKFTAVYEKAKEHKAAIAALPSRDTVKIVRNGMVETTVDRNKVVLVQTPQIFSKELIFAAYEKAMKDDFMATDDSAIAEYFGARVYVVEGCKENIKITYPSDIILAQMIMEAKE